MVFAGILVIASFIHFHFVCCGALWAGFGGDGDPDEQQNYRIDTLAEVKIQEDSEITHLSRNIFGLLFFLPDTVVVMATAASTAAATSNGAVIYGRRKVCVRKVCIDRIDGELVQG